MLSHHIIIADDDAPVRALLARTIVRLYPSVHITAVVDGDDALEELDQQRVDLLITDHLMPNMTGLELIEQIRVRGLALPVLLITSLPDVAARAVALGASEALVKPVRVAELRQALIRLLPPSP
jgi:CheY-like chemotaxis protein